MVATSNKDVLHVRRELKLKAFPLPIALAVVLSGLVCGSADELNILNMMVQGGPNKCSTLRKCRLVFVG